MHHWLLLRLVIAAMFLAVLAPASALERRINTWLVAGTFPSADEAAFMKDPFNPAELAPRLKADVAGKPWQVCDDRLYCRNLDDYVDLYTFFHQKRSGGNPQPIVNVAAYAHTWVWSPEARDIQIRLGINDGFRVWVNGKDVATSFSLMRWAPRDSDVVAARLESGWNRLLLKIQNGRGIYGFYCKLADAERRPLEGLEYAIEPPEGGLRVVSNEMPVGFSLTPYCWTEIYGVSNADPRVPSASPLRLMAAGGTPPYRWTLRAAEMLPPGLYLNGSEGEIMGVCASQPGEYRFMVEVADASRTTATQMLSIQVRERPSRWFEETRIGGLIHSGKSPENPHGEPNEQAKMMKREGFAWAAPTTGWYIMREDWPGKYYSEEKLRATGDFKKMGGVMRRHQDMSGYKRAFEAQGIRFGTYVGLPDAVGYTFENDAELNAGWPMFLDALHRHFEDMCLEYQPVLYYMDGAGRPFQDRNDWNFDAMYSLVKTLTPEALLMPNLASGHDDFGVGDLDVASIEGGNDGEAYWTRWARPTQGLNSKYFPYETWRYPFAWEDWKDYPERTKNRKPGEPDYVDPAEWARVIVSLIGEGYVADLDHSVSPPREVMHRKLGEWMEPRLESMVGTWPGPLREADWGYDVISAEGDVIYLHLLANKRGKKGWNGEPELTVGSLEREVSRVRVVPTGEKVGFKQFENALTLEMGKVKKDPVDTIIAIELK